MEPYLNLNGNSNIESYLIDIDSITVKFKSGIQCHYLYTDKNPGIDILQQMKIYAQQGHGLNSYISRVVKGRFDKKW